ncbi:MAG: TIGR02186 family protein [Devosia sp.]|jgi:uncharacterized protein (TIGR02186 family)|uniref:TIGR02186 family protein n=1 Tax=unclassified Devosia TaxID=196773 RepID=UPI0019F629DD|nr:MULTISPECIES: TIGR02186 family protein [unclassified Devosia]MBF0678612.1 TIGR02186 family protein [Devosia sp.]WEJ31817.1 TIGR02186 family protein [Devosia sp. SD17-2]
MRHFQCVILAFFALVSAAFAQDQVEVVFVNSDPVVAVHSNFRGQAITLFGNIEPTAGAPSGPYSVVVLVQGPSSDWVVREKERQFGLFLNSGSAHYAATPSYYAILSSSPLAQIADPEIIGQPRLSLPGMAVLARSDEGAEDFDAEFVRLMRRSGRFVEEERGVNMLSPTAFSVRVPLASDVTNGLYLARALVFSNGQIVGEATTRFTVRTQGFERFVADTARMNPALYGFATILLALLTGWLGGVLFKR